MRFDQTVCRLLADGFGTSSRSASHPVLTGSIAECAEAEGIPEAAALGHTGTDEDDAPAQLRALAAAHVRGVLVAWSAFFAGTGARRVPDSPAYAFARERFWLESLPVDGPPARRTLRRPGSGFRRDR